MGENPIRAGSWHVANLTDKEAMDQDVVVDPLSGWYAQVLLNVTLGHRGLMETRIVVLLG